jgi:hypothetical protein
MPEVKARWKSILTHWKAILTCSLKNWMQKDKDKWPFDQLSWKRWAPLLMKRSISHPGVLCTSMAIGIKWCPSLSPLYLQILTMVLSSTTTLVGRLMAFKVTFTYIKSITTTLTMKTWSFQVMYKSAHNKTPNVRACHHSFHVTCPLSWTRAYMMSRMVSCVVIC